MLESFEELIREHLKEKLKLEEVYVNFLPNKSCVSLKSKIENIKNFDTYFVGINVINKNDKQDISIVEKIEKELLKFYNLNFRNEENTYRIVSSKIDIPAFFIGITENDNMNIFSTTLKFIVIKV